MHLCSEGLLMRASQAQADAGAQGRAGSTACLPACRGGTWMDARPKRPLQP